MDLKSSVMELKGVGEQRKKQLERLGIFRINDLLNHFPKEYEDRTELRKIKDLVINETNTFLGRVKKVGENIRIGRLQITRVKIDDATGSIDVVWYNQSYMKNVLREGREYLFTGKLQKKYGKMEIVSPAYEEVGEKIKGQVVPIYPLTHGLSQNIIRKLMENALMEVSGEIVEVLPFWVRKKYLLCERSFAIKNIHFSEEKDTFLVARKRLVFEEFFLLQMALLRLKATLQEEIPGFQLKNHVNFNEIIEKIPFSLTHAQEIVLKEIQGDMASGKVMNRLVQGDVGSGKTAVAMVSAYGVIKSGMQVALMVPTEVLAEQHYQSFCEIYEKFGIKTVLLTGSLTAKKKREVLEQIVTGEAQMVIGTHAVIQKNVMFDKLGFVITDEQHRFGVRQRGVLSEKGVNPHVLVMTATPIPRTLALILYGDLDISIIDTLPPGRQPIDTSAVTPDYHERIFRFMEKYIKQGKQAYVICPMVAENEDMDLKAAVEYTTFLQEEVFPEYQVVCLHGKMKPKEKQEIMEGFTNGGIQVLVSTTVIEVGINVPNAVIMLIENAERFGLAQLHQLRGRVGRGMDKSYCILVSESKGKIVKERLQAMVQSTDGFYISEMDLKLRGPGDFFGTKQHGLPALHIANLYQDMSILKEAQEAANTLIQADCTLEKEEHHRVGNALNDLLKEETICI